MVSIPRKWIVVASSLIALLACATTQAQPYHPPAGSVLIRPFGDSITYGFGFTDYTYCPTYLNNQKWCGEPLPMGGGYRGWMTWIVLSSIATETTPPLTFMTEGHQNGGSYIQQWQTATQAHDGYPGFRTDQLVPVSKMPSFSNITLVHAGTNDIVQNIKVNVAVGNLFQILPNLLTANQGTQVFVAQIIPFAKPASTCQAFGKPCLDFSSKNAQVTHYNQLIQQKWSALPPAQKERITIVDMSGILNGLSGITPDDDYSLDGVHPSPMGYMKMACTWIRAIQGLPSETNQCLGIGPLPPSFPTPEQMMRMMQNLPPI